MALLCSLGWPPSSLCLHKGGEYIRDQEGPEGSVLKKQNIRLKLRKLLLCSRLILQIVDLGAWSWFLGLSQGILLKGWFAGSKGMVITRIQNRIAKNRPGRTHPIFIFGRLIRDCGLEGPYLTNTFTVPGTVELQVLQLLTHVTLTITLWGRGGSVIAIFWMKKWNHSKVK